MAQPTYPGQPGMAYGTMPGPQGPPTAELQTIRTMFTLAKVFAILAVILFLVEAAFAVATIFFAFVAVVYVVLAIVPIMIFVKVGELQRMVDAGQYQQAKDKTLLWMILAFLFALLLGGIFLLLAYLKFDNLINWQRSQGMGAPMMAAQPGYPTAAPAYAPASAPAPMAAPAATMSAPAPAMAPAAPSAPMCPRCGKPATWIPQYNRWYCYSDQQYL